MRTIIIAAALTAALAACVAPPPPGATVLTECDRYAANLAIAAIRRLSGQLSPADISFVNATIAPAERICNRTSPDPAETPVLADINAELAQIFAR